MRTEDWEEFFMENMLSKKHRRKFPQTRERHVHADKWQTRTPKKKGQKSHFSTSLFTGHSPESQGCPYPNPWKRPLSPMHEGQKYTMPPQGHGTPQNKNRERGHTELILSHVAGQFLSIILAYPMHLCFLRITIGVFLWCPISSLVGAHGWILMAPISS